MCRSGACPARRMSERREVGEVSLECFCFKSIMFYVVYRVFYFPSNYIYITVTYDLYICICTYTLRCSESYLLPF